MSFCLLLVVSLCSYGYGYNSKRQLGAYHWYDQVVLPTGTSVHQHQLYHQVPENTAVVFTPQYSELENSRRSEPERVALDYRLARVYPVLIHFLSPEPLEQSGNLEAQYQLTFEPVHEYQTMEVTESKYPEQLVTDVQPHNGTESAEPLEFGTKVTTNRPSYSVPEKKSTTKTRTKNTNEQ
ncbi:uncharacterized protein [Halyomorpha halys]|uniref:uncharacterized protein n=1 Tax=Halyomorpha halys TaxID=286706 RepID=UPI0006D4E763|nr:uncharacterized protein LOC106687349 [Halyomorpha halys]